MYHGRLARRWALVAVICHVYSVADVLRTAIFVGAYILVVAVCLAGRLASCEADKEWQEGNESWEMHVDGFFVARSLGFCERIRSFVENSRQIAN